MRRFFSAPENFQAGKVILSIEETRHLRDVLRLRAGEKAQVFDGAGAEFLCEIETIGKKETILEIVREIAPAAPESRLDLSLAVALLKGEKFELVIQKAVELGVTKLIPLVTNRTDVKLKDAEKKTQRWRKIVLEASKQCGRAKLMKIEAPQELEIFVKSSASRHPGGESLFLFSERGGEKFSVSNPLENIIAVTGAEGGWEDSEIELAKANGFRIVTFGGRVLRAETAAVAVAAVLQNRFGDLN